MRSLHLPVWLNRGTAKTLAVFLHTWWQCVEKWMREPLTQIDPDNCTINSLDLLAAGRDIVRFNGEPERLYRLRVKYAFINAKDAGSVAGLQRIFDRLGVGYVEVLERRPNKDWDVIILRISDTQLSNNQVLLKRLIEKYGRTCRRYEFETIANLSLGIAVEEFNNRWFYDEAS